MGLKHVVLHTPGPEWIPGSNFQDQNENMIMEHVKHYAKFHEQGKLFLGGPYTDIDSGGMMIAVEGVTWDELEEFAGTDPAVLNGLLNFEIRTWYVAMEMDKN